MSGLLADAEIEESLPKIPGWVRDGSALHKTFECKDFKGSIRFVNAVANIANAVDHHPDLAISWSKVTVTTSSHDAGGITARDIDLALRLDAAAS